MRIFDRFNVCPFSYIQRYKCLMRSAVCVYADKWLLCNRTAPGVLMDWIGCQPQTKARPAEKRVKDLFFDSEELEGAGWAGGVTERSKWIRVELTRGVPSPAWEKKGKAIWKEWCSRHPWSLDLGACDPWRFCEIAAGLVKWPHCFCVIVMTTQPVQLVVIIELFLRTADSPSDTPSASE